MIKNISKRLISISKFKGYIANKDLAHKIISPPYDVLDSDEARIMAENNEFSFLRVNKPEIELDKNIDPYSQMVYKKGYENLMRFIRNGWLIKEDIEKIYIYGLTMNERTQIGIVSASSIDDYSNNIIKKHELTRAKKEKDRTNLTDIQNANVGPVFLTYRAKNEINSIVDQIIDQNPFINVVTEDNITHKLWKCNDFESNEIINQFQLVESCYIADGHHRAAAAYNVAKNRRDNAIKEGKIISGKEGFNNFLTIHFPHNQLKVFDYNRVIKSLAGIDDVEFIRRISENFIISDITNDPKPKKRHEFSMFFQGKWKKLEIKQKITEKSPIESLDSQLLTKLCLKPILGINDLTTDERIDFVGGIRGLKELENRCNKDCVVAFALYPVDIEEIMQVADAGLIMPPKSTWFEPKPRSGLVVREIS